MFTRKLGLSQKFKPRVTLSAHWRSLQRIQRTIISTILCFLIALILPLSIAQLSVSQSNIAAQPSPTQLINQAKTYYQSQQFTQAAIAWQQAADTFAAAGDPLNQAMALSNLSLTQQQLGRWSETREAIDRSLTILQKQPTSPDQQRILASSLDIRAQMQLAQGQPDAALKTWQQAGQQYKTLKLQDAYDRTQLNQAQALQDLGLYPKACKTLLTALSLDNQSCKISPQAITALEQQPITPLQISSLQSLGNVLRILGQTEQSQKILLLTGQLAQKQGDANLLATTYLSIGNTAHALGNRALQLSATPEITLPISLNQSSPCIQNLKQASATQLYGQAGSCFQQSTSATSPTIKLQSQLNLLSLLIETQQWAPIPSLLPQIQSTLNALPPNRTTLTAQLKWTQLLMCLRANDRQSLTSPLLNQCHVIPSTVQSTVLPKTQIPNWDAIRQIASTAYQQAQLLGDRRNSADALGYLGGLAFQTENLKEAQQFTEQALQQISAFDAPDIAYRWLWQLGRIHHQQGHTQDAIAAYRSAFTILKSLRGDLVAINPDVQFTFRDEVEPIYRELVALLLQPEQPDQAALRESRDVIEALQLAELNNFFQQACLEARPRPIDQLDPSAAVLYGILLPNRLAVITSQSGLPLHYHTIALNTSSSTSSMRSGAIEQTIEDLNATLNPAIAAAEPLRPNQQLYDWLIRPIAADLQQNNRKTLVFVLDGALRGVPLAALHDGQKFLIENYNLALAPGLQLLSSRSISPKRLKTLVGGLAEARQGFPALPNVQQEVKEISTFFPTEVLLNEQFTSNRLQRAIGDEPFPVVHLATHAQFSSRAENTFLLTWDERVNVNNLDQFLRERDRRLMKHPIELLILSACQTAVGDNRAALGLAGVAMRSGARSTLATLWAVNDQSTADLMAKFYAVLNKPGVNKAEALRQAQLSLLRSSNPEYHHPFYWASFVLIGNWL